MKISFRLICSAAVLGALGAIHLAAATAAVPLRAEILPAYAQTATALAADDLAGAQTAAAALAEKANAAEQHEIMARATAVARAVDLAAAREAFKPLSTSVEPLAVGEKDYVVLTCSMANADWVQHPGDVRNPYLGKSMQTCGEPKKIDAEHSPAGCGGDEHQEGSGHGCGGDAQDDSTGHKDHPM